MRFGARSQGFLDPIKVLSQLQRFAEPSEVMAPTELLRAGAILQARGLMNSQAIQHNLDWVWPYWVQKQFDPKDDAFVPRAFNLTHINLTHRNWTAVGIPNFPELSLVDPAGLVTPFFDGWSLDAWIVTEKGVQLIPCRLPAIDQTVDFVQGWAVETRVSAHELSLCSRAEALMENDQPVLRWSLQGLSDAKAWLVVSLRPYNPEGVSFIDTIEALPDGAAGWKVNRDQKVYFDAIPQKHGFSYYRRGDVHRLLQNLKGGEGIDCRVGMATAAALFELEPGKERQVTVRVPLLAEKKLLTADKPLAGTGWKESLQNQCHFKTDHQLFGFLYDVALRTVILHSPGDVYPGPYTYKRFWFRDAAFIMHAMLCVGFTDRVERAIELFPSRQLPTGYFLSQEGEWDSNGEALWILKHFYEMTGKKPEKKIQSSILRGAKWIQRKRLSDDLKERHAGLLPAGFSAEHLGPNDYYYWDDFWGIAGLRSAAYLANSFGQTAAATDFEKHAESFSHAVQKSINACAERLGLSAIPASPYRRMDAGAIGSLAAGYPLKLYLPGDVPLMNTVNFLMETSFVDGGFFQQISHSGINPYLTLHVAQILMRAGDPRFFSVMTAIAELATPTGQWPEAVHPRTRGGCMGDGQHVWAAAEWILMVRNCFVYEEEAPARLILCQGITPDWYEASGEASFGRTLTSFGSISVTVKVHQGKAVVSWEATWLNQEPILEIRLPGFMPVTAKPKDSSALLSPR